MQTSTRTPSHIPVYDAFEEEPGLAPVTRNPIIKVGKFLCSCAAAIWRGIKWIASAITATATSTWSTVVGVLTFTSKSNNADFDLTVSKPANIGEAEVEIIPSPTAAKVTNAHLSIAESAEARIRALRLASENFLHAVDARNEARSRKTRRPKVLAELRDAENMHREVLKDEIVRAEIFLQKKTRAS